MRAESGLIGPRPQGRVLSVIQQVPTGSHVTSTAVQFDAHPSSTKEDYEQNKNLYVMAKGSKHAVPTLATTAKTFELSYREPFKIRLPNIVTSEPSTISATLHITVEPLSGYSKDDLPQIRILDREPCPAGLPIPFRKYWDADLPKMMKSPSPFDYEQPMMPDVKGPTPFMSKVAPNEQLTKCIGLIFYPCWRENLNIQFLTSVLGISNVALIACLAALVFYGLPATGFAYTDKFVAMTAWSQLISNGILFTYKMYCACDFLELPTLYEYIHMTGTAVLMVVSATMFFGLYGLPANSWHMSILCVVIAGIAVIMIFKL